MAWGSPRRPTFVVSNLNDSGAGSLRQAIADAASSDTITFAVSGTITLSSSSLQISKNLNIDGSGQSITISGNNALQIMFIENFSATEPIVSLNALTFADGNGNGTGAGAIFNPGTLTVSNSTFRNAHADGDRAADLGPGAGAIYTFGTLTVINSTFAGNSGVIAGAICAFGTVTVINSTFTGNSSPSGAAIAQYQSVLPGEVDRLTVINSTFSGNSSIVESGTLGGALANFATAPASSFTLQNTIVANNTGGNCDVPLPPFQNYFQPIVDGGGNLSDDNTCGFTQSSSVSNTNPNLGPLQNNGGPTQTMALAPGSPAINTGVNTLAVDTSNNPLTTDQRGTGFARIINGTVDIGAFEYAPLALTCPTATARVGTPYSSALTAAGGVSPYTFSIAAGSLPAGLTLNMSTGTITGTPNVSYPYSFTGKLTDSSGVSTETTTDCAIAVSLASMQLNVSPSSLSFGTVRQFSLLHKDVTLQNTGAGSVSLGKVSVTPGPGTDPFEFISISVCPSSLATGKSCRIIVVLFADNVGAQSATLNIPNSAVGSPQAVPLSATVTNIRH